MRGQDHQQSDIFSYLSPEQRVRQDHPLRAIRAMADLALWSMSARFDAMYARTGRPSSAPEKLLRAQLIQMLYSVRSERLLMEEIDYSVLCRWFVGMNLDEPVWDVTVFTKNRDRLLDGDVAREFLCEVVQQAQERNLTSDEHFTVDGHVARSLGEFEEFSAQGAQEGITGRSGQPHGGLPRRETEQ
jgi:transposase